MLVFIELFWVTTQTVADCRVRPISLQNPLVQVARYSSNGPSGVILIIPPTGGENYIDRRYAKKLCRNGFSAYILQDWQGKHETRLSLSIHETLLSRAQKAIDRVLNEIEADQVGILGTSVGGIHAATAFVRHSKIDKAFLIVAGAPVAAVIAESNERTLSAVREQRLNKLTLNSIDQYKAALSKEINTDPLLLPPFKAGKRVAAAIALDDEMVPSRYQVRLAEALGANPLIKYNSGHFFTILRTWLFQSDRVLDFFQSN